VSSGRQALAAPGAAPLEDRATGARRHAGAEAMPPLPSAHVGLIGPFHKPKRVEKTARPRAASGQYRRGAGGHKRARKRGVKAGRRDASVASIGKTVHTCGCRCGRPVFPCKLASFCPR
jgi:hypothetical protein